MINEAFGWVWIGVGMAAGAALGAGFQREGFLGGYASRRRRLLRLAHVACIALGALNVLYAQGSDAAAATVAGWGLLSGAVLMPLCCVLAAWRPRAHALFPVPVLAILVGVGAAAREAVAS